MSRLLLRLAYLISIIVLFPFFLPKTILAAAAPESCFSTSKHVSLQNTSIPLNNVPSDTKTISFTFSGMPDNTLNYFINFENKAKSFATIPINNQITLSISDIGTLGVDNHDGWLWYNTSPTTSEPFCSGINITIVNSCTLAYTPNPAKGDNTNKTTINVSRVIPGIYSINLDGQLLSGKNITVNASGQGTTELDPFTPAMIGNHSISIGGFTKNNSGRISNDFCITSLPVNNPANLNPVTGGNIAGPGAPAATPCTDPKTCSSGGGDPCGDTNDKRGPGIKTAIGCIHTNPAEFVKDLLKFIVAIGGGLAFLMMLLGAFGMLTSGGNPESLNAGRERLTSAIIGLLFVIFAVLLMQIIGVGFLCLPGFGTCK